MTLKILLLLFVMINVISIADGINKPTYTVPPGYESKSAVDKQTVLWKNILDTQTVDPQPAFPSNFKLSDLYLFSVHYLTKTFRTRGDFMPKGRSKIVHPIGSVAKIEFIPTPTSAGTQQYKGIYKGAIGLARISLALNDAPNGSYTPGMALKFLIDGNPSVNVFTLYSLDGQARDRNPFANTLTTNLPTPTSAARFLNLSFSRVKAVKGNPLYLRVDHLAIRDSQGNKETVPTGHPYELHFVPVQTTRIPSNSTEDIRDQLAKVPENSLLYNVEAVDAKDGTPEKIGEIWTRSPFVASTFGDQNLFFRHPSDQ